tara:strand:+ start:2240 stop:2956 length:717 start_codon:yes stop_codon:yes gene_type:complete
MENIDKLSHEVKAYLNQRGVFNDLVKRELQFNILNKVNISNEEINNQFLAFRKENELENDEKFDLWLKTNSFTIESFKQALSQPLCLKEYCKNNFYHKVESTYLSKKESYDLYVYSLLRTSDALKAREFYLQIQDKEVEFGELSAKYSEGDEKITRGIVGPNPIVKCHPILRDALKASQVGELNPPLKIENLTIISRLETRMESKLDEKLTFQIAQELYNEWITNESMEISKKYLSKN